LKKLSATYRVNTLRLAQFRHFYLAKNVQFAADS
jgi:hypothetical protein